MGVAAVQGLSPQTSFRWLCQQITVRGIYTHPYTTYDAGCYRTVVTPIFCPLDRYQNKYFLFDDPISLIPSVPVLDSLKETWSTVTRFNSIGVWLLVVGVAGGIGLFISWELSQLWEQLFGYSSVMTSLTTIIVLLVSHFCLSYLVSSVLHTQEVSAK